LILEPDLSDHGNEETLLSQVSKGKDTGTLFMLLLDHGPATILRKLTSGVELGETSGTMASSAWTSGQEDMLSGIDATMVRTKPGTSTSKDQDIQDSHFVMESDSKSSQE
jgi:hypothetical protein